MQNLEEQYWFRTGERGIRVGLSAEFVQAIEGDWLALELAKPGVVVRAGESFGFITTDRASHDLRAPNEFRVIEVNRRSVANPQLTHLSPLAEGWLFEVQPAVTDAFEAGA